MPFGEKNFERVLCRKHEYFRQPPTLRRFAEDGQAQKVMGRKRTSGLGLTEDGGRQKNPYSPFYTRTPLEKWAIRHHPSAPWLSTDGGIILVTVGDVVWGFILDDLAYLQRKKRTRVIQQNIKHNVITIKRNVTQISNLRHYTGIG